MIAICIALSVAVSIMAVLLMFLIVFSTSLLDDLAEARGESKDARDALSEVQRLYQSLLTRRSRRAASIEQVTP